MSREQKKGAECFRAVVLDVNPLALFRAGRPQEASVCGAGGAQAVDRIYPRAVIEELVRYGGQSAACLHWPSYPEAARPPTVLAN